MLKGGYQIINFEETELTKDVGMVFSNIHDKITTTRKAILVSGLNIGGKLLRDVYVLFTEHGSNYEAYIPNVYIDDTLVTIHITVNSNDVVTVTY